jgi:predicted phage terminase large subunit-like protein
MTLELVQDGADEAEPDKKLQSEFWKKNGWRMGIASYATFASRGRVPWYPYRWLKDVAARIWEPLRKGGARIIINAPPRHGKTCLISHWLPTWYLETYPEKQIILTSYGGSIAGEWGGKVRDEFELNPFCLTRLRMDSKARENWSTQEGGGMTTSGISGPLTGRGFSLGIIDDIHKDWEEAMSPLARERIIDWFNATFYTRMEPSASIVTIQTRWQEGDLSGYLINSHHDKWTVLKYPAIAEDENDLLGRQPGEALCPERYDIDRLESIKKTLGSYIFAGLYQQRPAPLLGGMIQRAWLRYWSELPTRIDQWIQSWDLTFKATGSSYAVGQVWARAGACYYLVDQVRGKWDFIEQVKQIIALSRQYPQATEKCIEDAADAQAVKSTLQAAVPGIVLVPARGSKEARLASVLGLCEAGNVYLPAHAEWREDLTLELTTFPTSLNNDQVDAFSHALARLSSSTTFDFAGLRLPDEGLRSNPWEF